MKIGLTVTENEQKHQLYIKWLRGNDNIDIIELTDKDKVNNCDALVLSGGIDIHPEFFNGALNYNNKPENGWKKERDLLEKSLLDAALQKSIPVLGICRGLQFINVHFGGTLVQDLGDDGNKIHKGSPDKKHEVNVQKGTLLSEIISAEENEINSAHHQAIDQLGKGLKINCISKDGIIEGIEWSDPTNKPFLLAVQWHPERMSTFNLENSAASKGIRERFIEEIKKT